MYKKRLTTKQRKFADLYINNGCNGYKACIGAGYKVSKNTRKTAHELLKNPLIKAYIRYQIEKSSLISRAELLNILDKISKGVFDENPKKTLNRLKAIEFLLKLYYKSEMTKNDSKVIILEDKNNNLIDIKIA